MTKKIKLNGNVLAQGAFKGTVFRLKKGSVLSLDKLDLPENPIFVSRERLTVVELGRLPGPCGVLVKGGGSTSEDYNYIASGGRYNEIIFFANSIRGDLDELYDYMSAIVGMDAEDNIWVLENIDNRISEVDENGIPYSTEEDSTVVKSLDTLDNEINKIENPKEIFKLAEKLLVFSNSNSMDEKYRVGELLAYAINKNNNCVHTLLRLSNSEDRQSRFTAARCMSKMAEKNPELLPEKGIRAILQKDLNDRSIPLLISRALGKGKHTVNVKNMIKAFINESKYSNIVLEVQSFINDDKPRNFYGNK